ncbi:unnamed protein product [Danaus chrysippus]|uniref:(African queen) hypothetical protein n=1 Tax=Danaus chrysippus TaxID=151541 RepID=A0A8J2R2H0_9NEOP|nr:unnamed protein product [Danaus chrysippus]
MKLLTLVTIFAVAVSTHARTAVRQQSVSGHITSLSDKDARQKASVHPAFANAGTKAGLEIWRIEVDPLISSMNKGDVFILDVDSSILVYVGSSAKNVEKLKAISIANQIRDQDHNGRGKVEIIGEWRMI